MAEAAGLVIGGISLAALFTTCLECMEYISLGANHAKDYELALTKEVLLKARLNAWGEALRVEYRGGEADVLRRRWDREGESVVRCLGGIVALFEDVEALERKYGLQVYDSAVVGAGAVANGGGRRGERGGGMRQIVERFRVVTLNRQNSTSLRRKTMWAIRDKNKFDDLLAQIAFYVESLEQLNASLQVWGAQQESLRRTVSRITDVESIALLEAAGAPDIVDGEGAESTGQAGQAQALGHTYIGTIIKERARVLNGDLGVVQGGARHTYKDTQAWGDAKVVQGNMSAEAARDFFK